MCNWTWTFQLHKYKNLSSSQQAANKEEKETFIPLTKNFFNYTTVKLSRGFRRTSWKHVLLANTLHKDSYLTENKTLFVHTCSYFQHSLAKSLKANNQEGNPIEMNSLVGPINDLDHSPFRSLRPRSQISSSGGGVSSPKTQGPVVCSVAPNLPARPPSSSDNDSIRKNHWDMDYEGEWRMHVQILVFTYTSASQLS